MFRLCSLLLLLSGPVAAEVLTGPIRVIDADTVDIGADRTMRLIGIDAPELAQTCEDASGTIVTCGQWASDGVDRAWGGQMARCEVQAEDRYGRALAVCFVGALNINAEIVRQGLARRYREDRTYFEEEKEARLLGRGLWAYAMDDPAVWRAQQRAEQAAQNAAPGVCDIKGNISDNGRLYHLPGSRAYGPTRITLSKGERWFCSEEEARAAGWRPAAR